MIYRWRRRTTRLYIRPVAGVGAACCPKSMATVIDVATASPFAVYGELKPLICVCYTSDWCSRSHTRETEAYIFCPTCGHGAHEPCLLLYAEERLTTTADTTPHISPRTKHVRRFSTATATPSTAPASPIVASTPTSGHWLYPNEHAMFHSANASRAQSRAPSPSHEDHLGRSTVFSQCPAGCGHQCSLSLPAL